MFKISQKPKPGVCRANRCKEPPVAMTPDGIELCDRHHKMWIQAGSPAFDKPQDRQGRSANLAVPTEVVTALQVEATEAEQSVALIQTLPIATQADVDQLGVFGQAVRAKLKELEEKRKSVTQPMNQALRAANALFKPVRLHLEACKDALNARLLEAQAQSQAQQDQALKAIQDAGGHVDETTLTQAHEAPQLPEGASTRQVVDFTITDPKLVPHDLCSPDPAKIKVYAVAALLRGITEAPGLAFHYRQIVNQRAAQ